MVCLRGPGSQSFTMQSADDHLFPYSLRWSEAFRCRDIDDTTDAHTIALAVLREGSRSPDDQEREITARLVDRFGRWASGWRWAADEGSLGGGPVHAWCCPKHSLTTPEETAPRVHAALDEWRAWTLRLHARFQEHVVPQAAVQDVERSFQQAVTLLVHEVIVQTNAGDAWYNHCAQVLAWYLEFNGIDPADSAAMVEGAISGKFESWVGPDDASLAAVTGSLAQQVAKQQGNHG